MIHHDDDLREISALLHSTRRKPILLQSFQYLRDQRHSINPPLIHHIIHPIKSINGYNWSDRLSETCYFREETSSSGMHTCHLSPCHIYHYWSSLSMQEHFDLSGSLLRISSSSYKRLIASVMYRAALSLINEPEYISWHQLETRSHIPVPIEFFGRLSHMSKRRNKWENVTCARASRWHYARNM